MKHFCLLNTNMLIYKLNHFNPFFNRNRMKRVLTIISFILVFNSIHAQLKDVTVETYYISDANDTTDIQYIYDADGNITDSVKLEEGSTTYRIYVQLNPGYKLTKIYGDENHTLKISSTANFFNHIDRGVSFGKDLANIRLKENTVALDSWLTLGQATKTNFGVLKTEDNDGSMIGGKNNKDGLLTNADTAAGIPLTAEDGLDSSKITTISGWFDYGIINSQSNADSTIFGSVKAGKQFISNNAYIQNSGVMGTDSTINRILVAQLTTKGVLSFELNIQVVDTLDLLSPVNIVAKEASTDSAEGNIVSSYLSYPPVCGCIDPNYLEYSSSYSCSNTDSCKTAIVSGCMDPLACNYDPKANYSIPSLCCYPGSCADRDISVVCPDLGADTTSQIKTLLYPNPTVDYINVEVTTDNSETRIEVYNSFGRLILNKNLGLVSGTISSQIGLSGLENGLYLVRFFVGNHSESKTFIKN
jgi:hypothetical protein